MCNLNFNQCNSGSNYPPLLDTCRSQLLSLLNTNTTTIINPQATPSWLYANFIVPQDVWAGSLLGVRKQAGAGRAVNDNLDGSFLLNAGTYNIEYSAQGIVPANGLTLGLVVDGLAVPTSVSTSQSIGQSVELMGRAIVTIEQSGGLLSLNNLGNENITINRASITINRLN